MANSVLEDVTLIIVMIITGAVVCIIGYALQNWWIVGFGVTLASAIPILWLISEIFDSI